MFPGDHHNNYSYDSHLIGFFLGNFIQNELTQMRVQKRSMIDPVEYMEWAKLVAKRYQGRGLNIDDLCGEAYVGLIKACEKFDPSIGTRFELYSEWWIGREIRLAIVLNRTIKIPYIRFHEAKLYLKGRLTKKLTVSKQELLVDTVYCLGLLKAGYADRMEEIIDSFDSNSESYNVTLKMLSQILPLESEIIQLRLGLDGSEEKSFGAIGKLLGMNSGSVYYHYKKGIMKLRCKKVTSSKSIQD